jgi:hypothetical protein
MKRTLFAMALAVRTVAVVGRVALDNLQLSGAEKHYGL